MQLKKQTGHCPWLLGADSNLFVIFILFSQSDSIGNCISNYNVFVMITNYPYNLLQNTLTFSIACAIIDIENSFPKILYTGGFYHEYR